MRFRMTRTKAFAASCHRLEYSGGDKPVDGGVHHESPQFNSPAEILIPDYQRYLSERLEVALCPAALRLHGPTSFVGRVRRSHHPAIPLRLARHRAHQYSSEYRQTLTALFIKQQPHAMTRASDRRVQQRRSSSGKSSGTGNVFFHHRLTGRGWGNHRSLFSLTTMT